MRDSGDFLDVESKFCGRLSHVSGQLVMIPSSRALLSRVKRLPLDIWNTGCAAGTGAPPSPKTRNGLLFEPFFLSECALAGLGVRNFDAGAKFRGLSFLWASPFWGLKTSKI